MISRAIVVGVGIVFRVVRVVRGRGRDTRIMMGIGVGRIVRRRVMADRVGLWIGVGIIWRVTGVITRGGGRDRAGIITGRPAIIWARAATGGVGGARGRAATGGIGGVSGRGATGGIGGVSGRIAWGRAGPVMMGVGVLQGVVPIVVRLTKWCRVGAGIGRARVGGVGVGGVGLRLDLGGLS